MSEKANSKLTNTGLPEGTVTFLFTDIEGSTKLLKQLGAERYGQVLADQRRILRRAFQQFNGTEIDTQGDSFFVSFPRATQAVAAVVEIQRALPAHDWPEGVEVRVRMGLHTGEPLRADEGYVGMDVHRAARIAHVGHGGQVLLSETTTPLVFDELPEGVKLLDLGRHLLKDMRRPEHIHQLVIEGLPADFPPLKSLGAELAPPQHNLPAPVSSFVGRKEELTAIANCLENPANRLLTLTGPPGVGKTRLALESARGQVDHYASGVWLVELAPVDKAEGILPAIASAIGVDIGRGSGVDLENALETSLNRGPLLLVIDNCEHLLSGIATLAGKLLRHCPQLTILATSREVLQVTGEVTYSVPTFDVYGDRFADLEQLKASEAVHLFTERVRAFQPDYTLTSDNLVYLSRICRHLDGIALAIELAAARLRVMSERELAENLGKRFALLTSGGRDVLPKMRTLRASLEWSYELLDPLEQGVLDRLSVFRGGCTLPEAQYVCRNEGMQSWEVLEILASLIEKSLVLKKESPSGRTRYETLESIIELGREHLQENCTWMDIRQRHAQAYTRLAEEGGQYVRNKNDAPWMERLVEDETNLTAALHFWNEIRDAERVFHFTRHLRIYYMHRSHFWAELANLVQGYLDADMNISPSTRGLGLLTVGWYYHFRDVLTAKTYYAKARKIGSQENDTHLLMQSVFAEAAADFLIGDDEALIQNSDQALKLAKQLGEEKTLWILRWYRTSTISQQERQEELQECIKEANRTDNTNMLAVASQSLGYVKLNLGEMEAALEYLWTEFRSWQRLKNRSFLLDSLSSIALIHQWRGDYEQAAALLEQTHQLAKKAGRPDALGEVLLGKAGLAFERGDLHQARNHIDESTPMIGNRDNSKIENLLLSGRIAHVQGKYQDAKNYLEEACNLIGKPSINYGWPAIICLLAVNQHELGENRLALDNFRRVLTGYSKEMEHPEMVETFEWLAIYCADFGEWHTAARFVAAIDSLRQISGIVPPVPYREKWAETRKRVKMNLPEDVYRDAWNEASAIEQLSLPKYALEQLVALESGSRFVAHVGGMDL